MTEKKSNTPNSAEKVEEKSTAETAKKADKKPEIAAKSEKVEKTEKAEKADKSAKAENSKKDEKAEKAEKAEPKPATPKNIENLPIKTALISVSDKTGVVDFAKNLQKLGVKIISTGGTAKLLTQNGVKVMEVGLFTGFPEMLDGRVKTLHPKIHAGILARVDSPEHLQSLEKFRIPTIDIVCVNLYPFEKTIAADNQNLTFEQAIENIDIGGPTMVRAAAKNYNGTAIVTDDADYSAIVDELNKISVTDKDGKKIPAISLKTRYNLSKKAFVHTARYDSAIANFFTSLDDEIYKNDITTPIKAEQKSAFPRKLHQNFDLVQTLRYGENPHQKAAFYKETNPLRESLATYQQVQGKELSYNNLADADAAWECVKAFPRKTHACVIVKHANPCGVATGLDQLEAYEKAFQTDATSAFGGIMAFNQALDTEVIRTMFSKKHFVEVIIAPYVNEDAKRLLAEKPNIRVLIVPLVSGGEPKKQMEMKRIGGGLLLQSADDFMVEENSPTLKVVSIKKPTPKEMQDMIFAMRVAKFIKSNAIVFCRDQMTLGIGAGQMSRVDSARIAAFKATEANSSLKNSVVASDAFFPFRDGLDVLAEFGASAVIQPGGSVRDDEVIAAANEHKIAMVFTGHRHFRH